MLKKLLFFIFIVFITIVFTFSHDNYLEIEKYDNSDLEDTNSIELQLILDYFYNELGIKKSDLEDSIFSNLFQEFDYTKDLFSQSVIALQ